MATSFFGGSFYSAEFFNYGGTSGSFYNGEFFDGEFFFEAAEFGPIGPGGPPLAKHADRTKRKARERLRKQLETAFNSEYGILAEQALAEFIEPQLSDSVLRPAIDRFDFELAWTRYAEVMEHLARIAEEDDDEALITLA